MDSFPDATPRETLDIQSAGQQSPPVEGSSVEESSEQYVDRWNCLVSTTNWEKGRIICEWRETLIEAGASPGSWTDESWSRRAGGVSPQHSGRLRRVYRRFGEVHQQYAGLYWSHFQAALDWPDAEMWLEGAVQSGWSVAQMRDQRWRSVGAPPQKKPRPEEIVPAELDEDFTGPELTGPDFTAGDEQPLPETISASLGVVQDAPSMARQTPEDPPYEASDAGPSQRSDRPTDRATVEPFRPFENFAPLPPDLNEAFENLKLAILRHKLTGWREIPLGDLLLALDALKQLALAPPED